MKGNNWSSKDIMNAVCFGLFVFTVITLIAMAMGA